MYREHIGLGLCKFSELYETYYLAPIIFIVTLFMMFFIIFRFIASLKVVFIHAKRLTWRQNRWAIAPILQGKLNMLYLPCKTVQDYPAGLHAGYCATLQRVGYLARCCTQYIARYLARNIASCRQAFKGHYQQNRSTWLGFEC